jgi:ribonuclease BN (tRNA processing enzyme)
VIRLTVLGSSGTYPAAGRACSGYLLEADEGGRTTRVWVDTGPGTLANLLRVADLPSLDAIWVSHLHVDHVGDLLAANYALRDGERVDLGPLRLEAVATVHSVETYAVRASAGGRAIAYSADSGPCDGLTRLADQADLFVCEAAWQEWPEGAPPIHLTPQLAGEWAAKARAKQLLLTHLRPGSDSAAAAARAAEAYGGPVGVATELEVYEF